MVVIISSIDLIDLFTFKCCSVLFFPHFVASFYYVYFSKFFIHILSHYSYLLIGLFFTCFMVYVIIRFVMILNLFFYLSFYSCSLLSCVI